MDNRGRSIAVMQPYIFPYLGYFKMIENVDRFIIYDNVQYINRGYINRNKILINGEPKYFNFQIDKEDQFKNIDKVKLKNYKTAREKLLNQLFFSYKKSPFFSETYSFIEVMLHHDFNFISELNFMTLKQIADKLDLKAEFIRSSELNLDGFVDLSKEDKLNVIIEKEEAKTILMPPGSRELYETWLPQFGCTKKTLEVNMSRYKQFSKDFVSHLSIIDVLMFNGFKETSKVFRSNEGV
jgi:hypothetical protein